MKDKNPFWKVFGAFLAYTLPLVFYRALIAKYFWNWFVGPTLHVPEFSYLQWLGLCMFIGIFAGGIDTTPRSEVKTWHLLISALELCVPEEKREALREIGRSWPDAPGSESAIYLGGAVVAYSVTLLLGYLLHIILR